MYKAPRIWVFWREDRRSIPGMEVIWLSAVSKAPRCLLSSVQGVEQDTCISTSAEIKNVWICTSIVADVIAYA